MLPLLLCLLGGACDEPSPGPATPAPPALRIYRLASLHGTVPDGERGFPSTPPPPPHCEGRAGCVMERWLPAESPEPGESAPEQIWFTHRGSDAWLEGLGDGLIHPGATSWPRMGTVLGPCVGDALALPPAGDPEGGRTLEIEGSSSTWALHFGGANPCGLSGTLRLPLGGGPVDTRQLQVAGHRWDEGGHLRAQEQRHAWRPQRVRERWTEHDPADKLLAIKGLSEDRDPEAAVLLRAIIERDPGAAADAEAALVRRSAHLAQEHP